MEHTHTYTRTTHTHTRAHTHTHVYIYIYNTHAHTHMCIYLYIYILIMSMIVTFSPSKHHTMGRHTPFPENNESPDHLNHWLTARGQISHGRKFHGTLWKWKTSLREFQKKSGKHPVYRWYSQWKHPFSSSWLLQGRKCSHAERWLHAFPCPNEMLASEPTLVTRRTLK